MTRRIRHCAKDEAGFSLSELMVVIAIIGILSAIALPSLLGNLPEKRLKNAARNLYSDMQRARLQAVKLNKTVTAKDFDNTHGSYNLTYIEKNGEPPKTIKTGSLTEYGDVVFGCNGVTDWNGKAAAAPSGELAFKKTGTATPFVIFLGSKNVNACYAVEVTNFGAVKIRWQHKSGSWN